MFMIEPQDCARHDFFGPDTAIDPPKFRPPYDGDLSNYPLRQLLKKWYKTCNNNYLYPVIIFPIDYFLSLLYHAISTFMAVYYVRITEYLELHANQSQNQVNGYGKTLVLMKARVVLSILLAYTSILNAWWAFSFFVTIEGYPDPSRKRERRFAVYVRLRFLTAFSALFRIVVFVLSVPDLYSYEVREMRVPASNTRILRPLGGFSRDPTFGQLLRYYYKWSIFLAITAVLILITFLIDPVFLGYFVEEKSGRSVAEIIRIFVFTVFKPFWAALDILISVTFWIEYLGRKFLTSADPSDSILGNIVNPPDYKQPKFSVSYYWARVGTRAVVGGVVLGFSNMVTILTNWFYKARFWLTETAWRMRPRASKDVTNHLNVEHDESCSSSRLSAHNTDQRDQGLVAFAMIDDPAHGSDLSA